VSVALYMDVHVPLALTEGWRNRGVDVITAQEDTTTQFPDQDLSDRATEIQRVLFTCDQDFHSLVARWQQQNRSFSGVIYAPQTTPLGIVLEHLEMCALACEPEDFSNRITYLPFPTP
jgi:hypothetical protein